MSKAITTSLNVLFTGTATQAQYADLAEKYTTDQEHPVGTIMTIPTLRDGEFECEMIACDLAGTPTGVISDKPAYLMNAESEGQAVALKGKVPVRVVGPAFKGEPIYSNVDGIGSQVIQDGKMIGIALETKEDEEEIITTLLNKFLELTNDSDKKPIIRKVLASEKLYIALNNTLSRLVKKYSETSFLLFILIFYFFSH